MKVKDIVSRLQALDQEADALCFSEDKRLLTNGHVFRLFGIGDISAGRGLLRKSGDGSPTIKFGKFPASQKVVLIHITVNV